ncbi:MAG TPA: type II secretion system protein [Gemmatimonadales bacterium]
MPRRSERGFALPLTVFVLVLITLLLAAAFVRVGAELRVGESGGDMVDALAIAQSGIAQYLNYHSERGTAPPDGDSVLFASIPPGGTATVVARIVGVDSVGRTVYLIRSLGTRIDPSVGADPRALRTVTQLAEWRSSTIEPPAAFLTHRRVELPDTVGGPGKRRGAGGGSGAGVLLTDGVDVPGCTGTTIPGLDENGVGGANNLRQQVGVDWPAIASSGYAARYRSLENLGTWSSYLIDGDATLSQSGSGLLVVTGALNTTGTSVTWNGVVLVGDSAVFDAATTTVSGFMMTGLNFVLTGHVPNPSPSIVMPQRTLQVFYHGCRVDSAMQQVTDRFEVIANTWFDRWMAN